MTVRRASGQAWMIGSLLAIAMPLCANPAAAMQRKLHFHAGSNHLHTTAQRYGEHRITFVRWHGHLKGGMKGKNRVLARRGGYGMQCVTFAKVETGIQLSGNAVDWWDNAVGVYQRGHRPELGSVLNFRANARMHLGHVAVVTNVVDSRQIDIDQANWPGPGIYRGSVARDIRVVDVSPANDWSAVRVELGHSTEFGSIYPTYGFIYDRGDNSSTEMTASADSTAPVPALNPAPADLRRAAPHYLALGQSMGYDEVAEAPDGRRLAGHHHRHGQHVAVHGRMRHHLRHS